MAGRPFADTLRELNRGNTATELDESFMQLVREVRKTGRKGSIVFTISVKPASKADTDQLVLTDDIKVRLPQPERGINIRFANADGVLATKDPRQPELANLRDVTVHPSAAKESSAS